MMTFEERKAKAHADYMDDTKPTVSPETLMFVKELLQPAPPYKEIDEAVEYMLECAKIIRERKHKGIEQEEARHIEILVSCAEQVGMFKDINSKQATRIAELNEELSTWQTSDLKKVRAALRDCMDNYVTVSANSGAEIDIDDIKSCAVYKSWEEALS